MPKDTWRGIPRSKIPWYPTINSEKCVNCRKCVDYCELGVYEVENGKKQPAVKNPNDCVVLCTGCDSICPAGAISHPQKKQTHEVISKLRKAYPLKRGKRQREGDADE